MPEWTGKTFGLFYHIWSPGGSDIWRLLVDEQIKRIDRSELRGRAGIHCCISGPQHERIRDFVACYDWINIVEATADESTFEGLTLRHLFDWCRNDPYAKYCAYIHTKGIGHFIRSEPGMVRAVNSWRHLLEWGVIDRWRDVARQLGSVDAAGINFRPNPRPHFGGNFWWATADYIRGLPNPVARTIMPEGIVEGDEQTQRRVSYELWVGLNNPKVYSFGDPPWGIDGKDWTFGYNLYVDDIRHSYMRL